MWWTPWDLSLIHILQTGIRTGVDAQIQSPGRIVLSARLFGEMIRKMLFSDVPGVSGASWPNTALHASYPLPGTL